MMTASEGSRATDSQNIKHFMDLAIPACVIRNNFQKHST